MVVCPEVTHGRAADGCDQITVDEIQEAMRRHTSGSRRSVGLYRGMVDNMDSYPYLAL